MIESTYRKTTLSNGIRVITEFIPNVRSVTTGIWVNVGSRDEAQNESGISHLLEHMIFRGTTRRSSFDIAKELDAIGGMSNAFTSRELTCFHAKVLDTHLDQAVDILLDIFRNSLFAEDDLEREKQIVLQEICMVEETPEDYANQLFYREFWGDNPLGRPIFGDADIVKTFNHERIVNYVRDAYVPGNVIIAAAGNLDHDEFVNALQAPLSEMVPRYGRNGRTSPQIQKTVKQFPHDLEQVHLCLGAPGPKSSDPYRYIYAILTTILGGNMSSRLFQEIREKRGLAYTVYSYTSSYVDVGLLGIYLAVQPTSVTASLEVLFSELEKLRSGHLEKHELEAAKEYLKGSLLLNAEDSENRMCRLAKNEFTFGKFVSFDEVLKEMEAVQVDQVIELAQTKLDPSKITVISYGPWEKDLDFFS